MCAPSTALCSSEWNVIFLSQIVIKSMAARNGPMVARPGLPGPDRELDLDHIRSGWPSLAFGYYLNFPSPLRLFPFCPLRWPPDRSVFRRSSTFFFSLSNVFSCLIVGDFVFLQVPSCWDRSLNTLFLSLSPFISLHLLRLSGSPFLCPGLRLLTPFSNFSYFGILYYTPFVEMLRCRTSLQIRVSFS